MTHSFDDSSTQFRQVLIALMFDISTQDPYWLSDIRRQTDLPIQLRYTRVFIIAFFDDHDVSCFTKTGENQVTKILLEQLGESSVNYDPSLSECPYRDSVQSRCSVKCHPLDGPLNFIATENGQCESIFCNKYVRLPTGRWTLPLPFRRPVSDVTFVGLTHSNGNYYWTRHCARCYISCRSNYILLGHISVATSPRRY